MVEMRRLAVMAACALVLTGCSGGDRADALVACERFAADHWGVSEDAVDGPKADPKMFSGDNPITVKSTASLAGGEPLPYTCTVKKVKDGWKLVRFEER